MAVDEHRARSGRPADLAEHPACSRWVSMPASAISRRSSAAHASAGCRWAVTEGTRRSRHSSSTKRCVWAAMYLNTSSRGAAWFTAGTIAWASVFERTSARACGLRGASEEASALRCGLSLVQPRAGCDPSGQARRAPRGQAAAGRQGSGGFSGPSVGSEARGQCPSVVAPGPWLAAGVTRREVRSAGPP